MMKALKRIFLTIFHGRRQTRSGRRTGMLKREFKDEKERLRHILKNQVYGLAPTEIIYKISTNYILGFAEGMEKIEHNSPGTACSLRRQELWKR